MRGPVALVGGGEFLPPARDLDAWLLARAGTRTVTVLPTAAARERPGMAVATARRHFEALGAEVDAAMVLDRRDAGEPGTGDRLAASRFLYLAGGDPRHLAATLRDTPAWEGILAALASGAVLAGSSAGAMVLCDRMLVPGSDGTETGLGLLPGMVVIPHHERWSDRVPGMVRALDGSGSVVLGIDEATGLVLEEGGARVLGARSVTAYRDGAALWTRTAPSELPGWP